MRLLHTSDWHLGHLFCGRRRDGEFRDFLAWLLELIARESVDVLLIAGDLFDTNTPGNACAGMYYDFLTRVRRESGCRRVVITGGNLNVLNDTVMHSSLYYKAFNMFNPFL